MSTEFGSRPLPAGADNPTVIGEVIRRTGVDVREDATRETMVEAFTTARIDLSVDECLPAAQEWRPDLIVHDRMDYVGPFLAAACDVPAAVHTFGSDVSADFIRAATERAVTDFERRGVRWRNARWVLDICPPCTPIPTCSVRSSANWQRGVLACG